MDTLISTSPKAEIVRTLRSWIKDGVFEVGVPIPSERELCRRLDANQRTFQKAIKILEDEKLILRKGRMTRMVAPNALTVKSDILSDTVLTLSSISHPEKFDLDEAHGLGWSDAIMKGVLNEVHHRGFHSLILNPKIFLSDTGKYLNQKPCGLFWVDWNIDPEGTGLEELTRCDIPVVAYGDHEKFKDIDRVSSDHEGGSYELASALIKSGRRKIMMILGSGDLRYWVKGRITGYERAMREAGLEPMPPLAESPVGVGISDLREAWTVMSRYHAGCLTEYFSVHGRPDVIMALSDGGIFSVSTACRILGVVPGKDIEIVGYDNYWQECPERAFESYVPAMTVDKRNLEMGHEMVRLLFQRRNGELPKQPQLRLVRPELVRTGR